MTIYKQQGLKTSILTPVTGNKTLFEMLKNYVVINDDINLTEYKIKEAIYVISGEILKDAQGEYIRNNTNIISRDHAFLDYDDIDISNADFIKLVNDNLQEYEYLLYPTINHTEENPRYRLILPLERPANEQEYKSTIQDIADAIGLKNDGSSGTFSQVQGIPVVKRSLEVFYNIIHKTGEPYPISTLKTNKEKNNNTYNTGETTEPIPHDQAIKYFGDYLKRNKKRLENDRTEYLKPFMIIAKSVILGQITIETAEECLHLLALNNKKYELGNIEHLHKELSYAKQFSQRSGKLASDYFTTKGTFKGAFLPKDKEGIYDLTSGEELFLSCNKQGIIFSITNYISLIRSTVYLGYNEITEQTEIYDGEKKRLRPIKEDDYTFIRVEVENKYGIEIPLREIKGATLFASKYNKYNPILNILQRSPWDGIKRAETLFIDFLGVEDNSYNREISKKILLASVARNFKEYVKFDEMLILQGVQGIGKTTLLQRLGFTKHYLSYRDKVDTEINIATKGKWIIELEELATLEKTDPETFKAWVSSTNDEYRGKYKESIHEQQRRFVIFGTTNKTQFLKDPTGHRRFLIFECNKDKITKDIFETNDEYFYQLWAEVLRMFLNGESFKIEKETINYMATINKEYSEFDELDFTILEIVELPYPNNWYTYLDDEINEDETKSKRKNIGKYVNDFLNYEASSVFDSYNTDIVDGFRTSEIIGIIRVIGKDDGLKNRQLEHKIKKVLIETGKWEYTNGVERNGKKHRGYSRK